MQESQRLIDQVDNVVLEVVQQEVQFARKCAPLMCSKCHIQGHIRTQCTSILESSL